MDAVFPIFVRAKDTGELSIFESVEEMQRELEAIDVENEEYEAWDKNGAPLSVAVQTPVWLKLWSPSSVANSKQLREAILKFASNIGVKMNESEESHIDCEALLKRVLEERDKKRPPGLFTRWRKQ